MDLRLRFRVEGIERYLRAKAGDSQLGLLETAPGVRSLQIRYDSSLLSLSALVTLLQVRPHSTFSHVSSHILPSLRISSHLLTSPSCRGLRRPSLLVMTALQTADREVPSAEAMQVSTRVLHLPCVLHDKWNKEAVEKYTQSNQAASGSHWTRPYLPDNSEFVAKQNGLASVDSVNEIILKASYMVRLLSLSDSF